jgi:PAS domain S-box-containing protein
VKCPMDWSILIIDDTPETVQMLGVWLQGLGYQTLVAKDGQSCVAAAAEHLPDLILLDTHMQSQDGIQLCQQLHSRTETQYIPVILMTGSSPGMARMETLSAGAADYVTKPINLRDLSERIDAILNTEAQGLTTASRFLHEVVDSALMTLPCDIAWILEVDLESALLRSSAMAASRSAGTVQNFWAELGSDATSFSVSFAVQHRQFFEAVSRRKIALNVAVSSFDDCNELQGMADALVGLGIHYVSLIPLVSSNQIRGVLILGAPDTCDLDSVHGWQLMSSVSNQASLAIDYVHLSNELLAQQEMVEAEHAFLTMILNAMGDGVVVIDELGAIEYVNRRLLRMSNHDEDDLIGVSFEILFHPDDREALKHGLLRGRGATFKFDQRLCTKQGNIIPVLLSRSFFDQIDSGSAQQIIVLSDLSVQKSREDTLERQSQHLRALNRAAEAISSSLSPHDVIERILNAAREMVNAEEASILLRNSENANELVFVAASGPVAQAIRGLRVPLGQGIAGWVAREAKSQLVSDASRDERFYGAIDDSSGVTTRSIIAVPLIVSDRVIGVLETINKLSGEFDRVDLDLMESIAGTAAVAIENARLFDQTRRRLNDLGTLLDASAAVSSTLDFGSVLDLIARRLLSALRVERCLIATWDHTLNVVESLAEVVDAYWGPGTGPIGELSRQPMRQAALQSGARAATHTDDPNGEPSEWDAMTAIGQRAMTCIPLRIDRQTVGLVLLYSSQPGRVFNAAFVERLEGILNSWSSGVRQTPGNPWDSKKSLTELCIKLQLLPGVMWIAVEQWFPKANQTRRLRETGFSLREQLDGVQYTLADFPTMTRVLAIAQPKVVSLEELAADPHEQGLLTQLGGQVCLMAPLMVRGKPEGLVKLIDSDPRRVFDAEEISLCQGIANVVGNAMENAHLYQSLERRAEALEAAYADLKQADQLKNGLLQNLSHEIQTPLLHVLGYAELMYSEAFGPLTDEQREKLKFMIERAQQVSELTKNIITAQDLQTYDMDMFPVDLQAVLATVIQDKQAAAAKRQIEISLQAAVDLPTVLAEAHQLATAVGHLLDNALKFSRSRQRIVVRTQERGAVVEVSVRDHGIGIPKEHHEHIFQRFYQVDGSASRRFGGAGLGLAIVYEIITLHGGRVWVESEPGEGSTFYFTLPKASTIGAASRL